MWRQRKTIYALKAYCTCEAAYEGAVPYSANGKLYPYLG